MIATFSTVAMKPGNNAMMSSKHWKEVAGKLKLYAQ